MGGSMRPFFKDETFNFQTEVTLGATYHQAADVGEVLATVERIRNGQAQSWVDEWSATADRLAGEATASAEAGRSHSAAHQFLRVSMYYSVASNVADGTGDPTLFARLWEKHRAAWDRFVDLTDLQIEQIEIPYESTTLPGYFFRSGPAGEPRRKATRRLRWRGTALILVRILAHLPHHGWVLIQAGWGITIIIGVLENGMHQLRR